MTKHLSCDLSSVYISSPIGSMIIKSCTKGLHSVSQSDAIDDSNFDVIAGKCKSVKHDMDPKQLEKHYPIINDCVAWLSLYFSEPQMISSLQLPELCPTVATDKFHGRVWITLAQQVGLGSTVSYKDLAKMAGSPGAARAVGSAMANNPFQIVVPCHRVLPSSGRLGNYAYGKKNKVKSWLLHHEGVSVLI
ncbi:methylated-DNA--protein-cysteine methyltransferase-like isoform X2 [Ischnura elegans]|nr:methylated-DNA--protein-cysteine methyltransferase-like isoform X2 [Ischnura elegans]